MTTSKAPSLIELTNILRKLDESSIESDGSTSQFLEIRKNLNDEGININGNQSGLLHLARLILEVAQKGFDGAHQHFDEVGALDTCEVPLAICLKSAES